jgi:hypothetical protein
MPQYVEKFLVVIAGMGYYQYLVSGSPGCCQIFKNAQDHPYNNGHLA